MRKFEQEKFSRWFDVERIEADSFTTFIKNGSLQTKISSVKPEVIFMHLAKVIFGKGKTRVP